MPDIAALGPDTIKLGGGISGGIMSNLTGIPFDRFRILVAQDTARSTSVFSGHLVETFKSPAAAFTGGFARITMKQMAATLNLYVPQDFRERQPFLASFAVGVVFSPILNVPRMFQLGRVQGERYPDIARSLFTSVSGFKTYANNTLMFAPGEGLRMMMCFGAKDWIMPRVGGKVDAASVPNIPLHTGKMALIAGPSVAAVETTFALVTETVSTIHAAMHGAKGAEGGGSFSDVLRKTITPVYTWRCWQSLFIKNIMANTPLFWIMFMSDFYGRLAVARLRE